MRPGILVIQCIFFIVLFTIGSVMASDFDIEAEKAAISKVIDISIGWAANKDKDLLFNSVAQDSNFFIYNPNSHSDIGFDAFKDMVESVFMDDRFKATGYDIRDLKINISNSGDVAWYRAILDDFGEWDGKPYAWKNTRWTGVLEKRDGRWVITQMHFSFASDAQEDEETE